ncbi:hypothetical protein [Stenotrophomonas chelatiphaga]|uniref:hypothetical protein n=1 Tax=Stenotrophomonas chelatiphaga TaxID=517011 RepID=UPI000A89FE8D|nr:hypothetical protein [Stenotrophomonas chelatiphaga]
MDIPSPLGSSQRSAFAVITPATSSSRQPALTGIRSVSNSNSADTPATLPPLLKLDDSEKGSDLLGSLRRRCMIYSAPRVIDAALEFAGSLPTEQASVFLRTVTLALADDNRLCLALAAQRQQGAGPAPDASAAVLPPLLQEYVTALGALLRAVAVNGRVMDGTYGFTTYVSYCLHRIATAPALYVAETVLNEALHWQRGARLAIGGTDLNMVPRAGDDPLGPVLRAFALRDPTPDAAATLAELRQFHPAPSPDPALPDVR